MSRQLRDWGLIAANPAASVSLRVWDRDQVLVGVFTVNVPQAATMISTCTWNGAGWKDTYYGAEVLSITNGDIFAAPVDTLADLDTTSGEKLIVAFGMGISGVDQGQSAAEAFGGVALDGSQQLVLENRTSDPVAPVTGRIWIRTDL